MHRMIGPVRIASWKPLTPGTRGWSISWIGMFLISFELHFEDRRY